VEVVVEEGLVGVVAVACDVEYWSRG